MKINVKILSDFLKKIKMEGLEQVTEILMDFSDEGLIISAVSATNTVRVDGKLSRDAFTIYESIGEVAVQDLPTITKIIDRFSEEIEIVVEGNVITFKDKSKEMNTELMDKQFLKKLDDMKELGLDVSIDLPISVLHDLVSDANINRDFTKVSFKTGENAILLETDGKYVFKRSVNIEGLTSGTQVGFGNPFVNAVSNLKSNIKLELKTNFPARITEVTKESKVVIVVAPRIENK